MPNLPPTNVSQVAHSAWFVSVNPVLSAGERGIESDTGKFKVGTGSAKWAALPYGSGSAPSVTGSRGGNAALASLLTQLAAAGVITDNTVV